MTQLNYTNEPAVGIVGMVARDGRKPVIVKRTANGPVRAGQYVIFAVNSGSHDCQHPTAAPTALNRGGIAIRKSYDGTMNDGNYADNEAVDVLVDGEIFVAFETAITALQAVFVRHVAGGAEQLGALRLDADGTDASAVAGLRTMDAGTALVRLDVRPAA